MDRKFWRDLYPMSEARRRFTRSSLLWIYLPIGASILLAAGTAVAVLGVRPADGLSQPAQTATILMAAVLLAAGFFSWLVILASLWGLNELLDTLPVFTTRVRLQFVIGARSWTRTINGVKRTVAAVSRFFPPAKQKDPGPWQKRNQADRRGKNHYE